MEHDEYNEVVLEDIDVGGDDDVDQMNHRWIKQHMAREDIDVRGNDHTNYC
jgi:hypothetical protein